MIIHHCWSVRIVRLCGKSNLSFKFYLEKKVTQFFFCGQSFWVCLCCECEKREEGGRGDCFLMKFNYLYLTIIIYSTYNIITDSKYLYCMIFIFVIYIINYSSIMFTNSTFFFCIEISLVQIKKWVLRMSSDKEGNRNQSERLRQPNTQCSDDVLFLGFQMREY